jgi:ligand-binding sensor domain-containing protein
VNDIIPMDSALVVSQMGTVSGFSGSMTFPITTLDNSIITLGIDNESIYAGTSDGMFRIVRGTREAVQFGPDRYPVYIIFPGDSGLFVGGEAGFYRYSENSGKWEVVMKRGVKDIARLRDDLYLLTLDNQLIRFRPAQKDYSSMEDTTWTFLPYFNVYDIDTDGEVLYCATFAGVNYYDPATSHYHAVNNLPRVRYDYIFTGKEELFAVSDQGIFRLSLKYRD